MTVEKYKLWTWHPKRPCLAQWSRGNSNCRSTLLKNNPEEKGEMKYMEFLLKCTQEAGTMVFNHLDTVVKKLKSSRLGCICTLVHEQTTGSNMPLYLTWALVLFLILWEQREMYFKGHRSKRLPASDYEKYVWSQHIGSLQSALSSFCIWRSPCWNNWLLLLTEPSHVEPVNFWFPISWTSRDTYLLYKSSLYGYLWL